MDDRDRSGTHRRDSTRRPESHYVESLVGCVDLDLCDRALGRGWQVLHARVQGVPLVGIALHHNRCRCCDMRGFGRISHSCFCLGTPSFHCHIDRNDKDHLLGFFLAI